MHLVIACRHAGQHFDSDHGGCIQWNNRRSAEGTPRCPGKQRGQSVLVYGYISDSVARDLAVTLDSDPHISLVEFDSLGGRLSPAQEMADLIQSRGLDTRVSSRCASACTVVFLAGRGRYMRAGALFGFHAASAFNGIIGRDETENMRQRAIAAGVARSFVARAYQGTKVWVPSTVELKEAGVVTAILPKLEGTRAP